MDKGLVILSAGGTGGHVMPALALADALRRSGYACAMVTDARGARFRSMAADIPFHVLEAAAPAGGLRARLRGLAALLRGTVQALRLLRRLKPCAVVGFGGYPSVPGVAAARILGIPIVLHEANAVLGRANRFLAPFAHAVALSHRPSLSAGQGAEPGRSSAVCDHPPPVVTGNPIRPEFGHIGARPYGAPTRDGPFRILVTGGSLGAEVFGRVVPEALEGLPEALRRRIGLVQQCVADDGARVRARYAAAGIQAWIEPFFTDLPEQIDAAHLVVARSGASTVAEIAAAGRPAIFVPYPHHGDQQQMANARALEAAGAAWVFDQADFTPESLRKRIEALMNDPGALAEAAGKARSCAIPDAARRLADLVGHAALHGEDRGLSPSLTTR